MAPVTYFIRGRACSRWPQKKSRSDSPFSIRSYAPVAFRLVGEASTLGRSQYASSAGENRRLPKPPMSRRQRNAGAGCSKALNAGFGKASTCFPASQKVRSPTRPRSPPHPGPDRGRQVPSINERPVVRFHIRLSQSDRTELDAARAKWCGSDMDQGEQATAAQ